MQNLCATYNWLRRGGNIGILGLFVPQIIHFWPNEATDSLEGILFTGHFLRVMRPEYLSNTIKAPLELEFREDISVCL